eukprot:Clim_evm31s235 gene=Clim_evmTU31s235
MSYNYVATAQKPSTVTHLCHGYFTGGKTPNLIVGKTTYIEVYDVTPDGLSLVMEFNIYGRISNMMLVDGGEQIDSRSAGSTPLLAIATEKYSFCLLKYQKENGIIVSVATGDVEDKIGRPVETGQFMIASPDNKMLALRLYDGLLKILPLSFKSGQPLQEAYNVRLDELQVHDMVFLDEDAASKSLTLVVLSQDASDMHRVSYHTLDEDIKELITLQSPAPIMVEMGASMLIAVPKPLGGVLVVGEQTITYLNVEIGSDDAPVQRINLQMRQTVINCYGKVDDDGSRFLIADEEGNLSIVILANSNGKVEDLILERLGKINITNCIEYLDNGVVFAGSRFGDSQLIRLTSEQDESGSFIEVLQSFTNLGPITDIGIMEAQRNGQAQLITCSGAFKDGSLRIIRNGIGIEAMATIELGGIKGVWTLQCGAGAEAFEAVVISFVSDTKVVRIEADGEISVFDIAGFNQECMSLFCGNTAADGQIVQITNQSIRLIDQTTLQMVAEWKPTSGQPINVASCNDDKVLVAFGGNNIAYLELAKGTITQVQETALEHEVACLHIYEGKYAAAGLWNDMSVRLLSVPSLKETAQLIPSDGTIPRSVLLTQFEGSNYLLCGLGDGVLFSCVIDLNSFTLMDRKKVSLGTQPMQLIEFVSNGEAHVFATGDRPTVIHSSSGKVLYSNVNVPEVTRMCQFKQAQAYEAESLVLVTENTMVIGAIDEIQKLHIRTVPLGEMPRRLAIQNSTKSIGVITNKEDGYYLRIIDQETYDMVASHELDTDEWGVSICSMSFAGDENVYYVVGTTYVLPEQDEPDMGRVLIFSYSEGSLELVSTTNVDGAVYTLNEIRGKLLCSINSRVHIFQWKSEQKAMSLISSLGGSIMALYVKRRGDFIVVGDIMKSISLISYDGNQTMTEIAKDCNANWMSAVEIIDDDTYIGAENGFNLFVCHRNADAATDEERSRLEVVGEFHLGEFVNVFRHGSLVMQLPEESEQGIRPSLVFGTVSGMIGIVAHLTAEQYQFLWKLHQNLDTIIRGVGNFDHGAWRAFRNERREADARGFIDGDLIEKFLDLPKDRMPLATQNLIWTFGEKKGQNVAVEDLVRFVEELSQMH